MKNIILFSLFCIIGYKAEATTYYFSTSGDDNHSNAQAQNQNTPWASISKLNAFFNNISPGDSILFKRGDVFNGMIQPNVSGTNGNPIVFGAYGNGAKPVISGFTELTSWTNQGGGIYESNTSLNVSELNMLLIDGQNQRMGRYPNYDSPNKGYLTLTNPTTTSISGVDANTTDWTGAEIVIRMVPWILDRSEITSHNGTTLSFNQVSSYTPEDNYGYFIQNDIRTLDQFGEWFYDGQTGKVYVYFGNNTPSNHVIQASNIDILFEPTEDHIRVENIEFTGANKYVFYDFASGAEALSLHQVDLTFSGVDAIWLHSKKDFEITHSTIKNTNNNGIYLSWANTNAIIENNFIYNTGMQEGMGESDDLNQLAIFNSEGGASIQNNTIINTGYNGIHFSGYDNVIENNYVDTFCVVKDDGGGIYTYDGASSGGLPNSQIKGNLVFNGLGAAEGTTNIGGSAEGIYIDDNCSDIDVLDNTVFNIANNGIFIHNSDDITVQNNLVYHAKKQFFTKNDNLSSRTVTGLNVQHNVFFCKKANQMAAEFSSVDDDIQNLGSFDHNYYIKPINDELIIQEEYEDPNISSVLRESFTLALWQNAYSEDANSHVTPKQIPQYQIINVYPNVISNSTFDTGIQGTGGWSLNSDHSTSWNNTELDSGCFQIDAPTSFHTGFDIGAVDSSKTYLVRFSAKANKNATINLAVWQANSPWGTILGHHPVNVSTTRKEYEVLLKNIQPENDASFMFRLATENLTLYLDNVEFMEVDVNETNPDDHMDFFYNETGVATTVSLSKNYIDVDGTPVSGTLNLPPYSGKVLIVDGLVTNQSYSSKQYSKLRVFPNPAKDHFQFVLETNSDKIELDLIDLSGRSVLRKTIQGSAENWFIDVPQGISAGSFILSISDGEKVHTQPLILTD
ncbi:MAG: right-handed parallel beta-helix repeat-containing protein [Flavobacteriales bacterium]|nr:right-handed parallel beta-helix repeat-containing protein [Flavobacteriales bacterium]